MFSKAENKVKDVNHAVGRLDGFIRFYKWMFHMRDIGMVFFYRATIGFRIKEMGYILYDGNHFGPNSFGYRRLREF